MISNETISCDLCPADATAGCEFDNQFWLLCKAHRADFIRSRKLRPSEFWSLPDHDEVLDEDS